MSTPDRHVDAIDAVLDHVNERIREIEDDDRLDGEPAKAQINAPLALHQATQEARLAELRGVLRSFGVDPDGGQ